jgi:3-methyl-2-oxobutanoate hydroxymethyltransferase
MSGVTLPDLHAMKRAGEKIVCVVAWDTPMATLADRAGADLVSVGDTVGVNLWGQQNPLEITMEELLVACRAARRGVRRALLSCDFPFGPLQEGPDAAVRAAIRLVKEGGVDLVKLDGAAAYPEAVTAVDRAGIPVWAQFGITPQTALQHGVAYSAAADPDSVATAALTGAFVGEAKALEAAGASLLNFTNSGPVVGPAVVEAVGIPVLGGMGGGPWLDGRIKMATAAVGYGPANLDRPGDTYGNVARVVHDALTAYADDVRSGRQIRGGR